MLNIRIAKDKNDFLSASKIYAESWKTAYRGLLSDDSLNTIKEDNWLEYFTQSYEIYEIAIFNKSGKDIGALRYGFSRDYDNKEIGELTSLYLLPEYWGKGIAVTMMDFMFNRFRQIGFKMVHVWVLKYNVRAIKFYEKMNFAFSGNEDNVEVRGEAVSIIEYTRLLND